MRTALVMILKQQAQKQRGNKVGAGAKDVTEAALDVPIEQRAGYPLIPGKVDPENWKTIAGKRVFVDLARVTWLPDDWGQGVKLTNQISRSRPGHGGTYTVWVSPVGNVHYHRHTMEVELGRKLSYLDGFKGQRRLYQLQTRHTDDRKLFAVLSPKERRCLPRPDEFHFGVVSARRAQSKEGLADIARVQAHFDVSGVEPTWYVDKDSLQAYRALGLKAVVGGKLTEARNMVLKDAAKMGKACVQVSDDIGTWNYHDGAPAKDKSDDAMNAAYAAATVHIITPLAAARFMLAKLRACDTGNPKTSPQLAGVYMLPSCSRTFAGSPEVRRHFILGDFFVVDKSPVRFDMNMTLKEDYDFTCAHIAAHGSVIRCNRMTVHAKHQTNAGGAVAVRDKKGLEEQKNIAILFQKWPRAFRCHPKRKNEVVLKWPAKMGQAIGQTVDDEDNFESEVLSTSGTSGKSQKIVKNPKLKEKVSGKVVAARGKKLLGVKGAAKPMTPAQENKYPPDAVIVLGTATKGLDHIMQRRKAVNGKTVRQVIGMKYKDGSGQPKTYTITDLRYDILRSGLALKRVQ